MYTENTMGGACQQQGDFKENRKQKETYTQNQKETFEITVTHKRVWWI